MTVVEWYHGTNGDNVLQILKSGKLIPKGGQILFSASHVAGCFPMGADLKRKACFVIKVKVQIPNECKIEDRSTNVPHTKVVHTGKPLSATVLELHVRHGTPFEVDVIKGSAQIQHYFAR